MRISDWSSDVCSSDLVNFHGDVLRKAWPAAESAPPAGINTSSMTFLLPPAALHVPPQRPTINCATNLWIRCGSLLSEILTSRRSEERRVVKECVSTGRDRWDTWQ